MFYCVFQYNFNIYVFPLLLVHVLPHFTSLTKWIYFYEGQKASAGNVLRVNYQLKTENGTF